MNYNLFTNLYRSQRVVDTILEAFQVCAASQGCMNNITIGDSRFGYYETVAGGSGAVSFDCCFDLPFFLFIHSYVGSNMAWH